MKIEMGGKYIARCGLDANGQPKPLVEPVRILAIDKPSGDPVVVIGPPGLYTVKSDGSYVNQGHSDYDLLPWPEAPEFIPWGSLDEVPLDAWYRDKQAFSEEDEDTMCAACRVEGIAFSAGAIHIFDDCDSGKEMWVTLPQMFDQYERTHDLGKTWLPCGKRAT